MAFRVRDSGARMVPKMYLVARELYDHFWSLGYELAVIYGSTTTPDHNNLHCLDLSSAWAIDRSTGRTIAATKSFELGDTIARYLWANRNRLGLRLIIWNRRIIRTYNKQLDDGTLIPAGQWAPYTGAKTHTDHNHVQLDDSDYVPPADAIPTLGFPIMAGAKKIYRRLNEWAEVATTSPEPQQLQIDDPVNGARQYSFWSGPTAGLDLVAGVELDGLPAGGVATVFFGRVEVAGDQVKLEHAYDRPGGVDVFGRADGQPAQAEVSFKDAIGKPAAAGAQFRLRLFIRAPAPSPLLLRYRMVTRGWGIEP